MNVYIYQAALLCEDCARNVKKQPMPEHVREAIAEGWGDYDSDNWPCGPYTNGGGEADTPQHCDHCGVFLENPLTGDGYAYVREAIENGHNLIASDGALKIVWRNPGLKIWSEFYDIKPGEE